MATYFIDLQDIYSGTTIQSNVQNSLIYPFIERAQNDFVKKLVGTAQYDDLISKVSASGLTGLTSYDLELQKNLKPMLVLYTWYYATPFLAVKFDNKGINKLTSDNSEGISESRQIDLLNKILNLAQEAEGNALKFLRLNYQNYPLWREDIYYFEDTKPNTKLFGGIEFDSNYLDQIIYINGVAYRKGDLL